MQMCQIEHDCISASVGEYCIMYKIHISNNCNLYKPIYYISPTISMVSMDTGNISRVVHIYTFTSRLSVKFDQNPVSVRS